MLTACLILVCAAPMFGGDEIHVVTEELKPLNYVEDGIIKGTATEVVRKVLEKAGLKYTIEAYPWARAYDLAQNRENVLIYTINRTPRREDRFRWIGLVASRTVDASIYKLRSNNAVSGTTLQELRKYPIAVVRDDVNHEFLVEHGFARVNVLNNLSQCLGLLQRGRVDLIISSAVYLKEALVASNLPLESIEEMVIARESNPYMAISLQTSDAVYHRLKEAYDDLLAQGAIPVF